MTDTVLPILSTRWMPLILLDEGVLSLADMDNEKDYPADIIAQTRTALREALAANVLTAGPIDIVFHSSKKQAPVRNLVLMADKTSFESVKGLLNNQPLKNSGAFSYSDSAVIAWLDIHNTCVIMKPEEAAIAALEAFLKE